MRFDFIELPDETTPGRAPLARPVVPVQVEDLAEAPQLCLIDTGSTANRLGAWIADEVGIDLRAAPQSDVYLGGVLTRAHHGRCELTVAGVRYEAPVSFCNPWPFSFGLLGQEGFLRFFRLTICAAEFWVEVEPESAP